MGAEAAIFYSEYDSADNSTTLHMFVVSQIRPGAESFTYKQSEPPQPRGPYFASNFQSHLKDGLQTEGFSNEGVEYRVLYEGFSLPDTPFGVVGVSVQVSAATSGVANYSALTISASQTKPQQRDGNSADEDVAKAKIWLEDRGLIVTVKMVKDVREIIRVLGESEGGGLARMEEAARGNAPRGGDK